MKQIKLSDYALLNIKDLDNEIKDIKEELEKIKDKSTLTHIESLKMSLSTLIWVKQLLIPSVKLADIAYDAGTTHNEDSLMFDYPKSRFLNSNIEIK